MNDDKRDRGENKVSGEKERNGTKIARKSNWFPRGVQPSETMVEQL